MRAARAIARLRDERGVTLVELVVAMMIMSIVAVVFTTALAVVQNAVVRESAWSTNVDQARLAVENIDRMIRSGNVLFPPASDGSSIIVYTQSNAPSFKSGAWSGNRCMQWRVSGGQLQMRWWKPNEAGVTQSPTTWQVVASNIVNYVSPNNQVAFSLDPDPNKGGRTVLSVLLVNSSTRSAQTVKIQQALTARNTSYSYLSTACNPTPA
jgi:prepilin-type N-terminal cleavage/methylation domain-containing protein